MGIAIVSLVTRYRGLCAFRSMVVTNVVVETSIPSINGAIRSVSVEDGLYLV